MGKGVNNHKLLFCGGWMGWGGGGGGGGGVGRGIKPNKDRTVKRV